MHIHSDSPGRMLRGMTEDPDPAPDDRPSSAPSAGTADLVDRLAARISSPGWTWSSTLQLALLMVVISAGLAGVLLATAVAGPGNLAQAGGVGAAGGLAYGWTRRRR
jgi:hypothetical protein